MGTQKPNLANNNKVSYTAVLHRYIDSQAMPSRFDKEMNQHPMEDINHACSRLASDASKSDIRSSPFSQSPNSFDLRAHPNLPGIPVPYEYHVELKPEMQADGSNKRIKRRDIFNFLEGHKTFSSRVYHHFVIFIILSSIGFAVCATLKNTTDLFSRRMRNVTLGYELCLLLIFSIEYGLRVWSCSANSSYIGTIGRLRFIRRPIMILDAVTIVASLVLIIALVFNLKSEEYRYLFLLQLFRVLRIDRHRGAFETFKCVVRNHFKELLTCWYMGFIVIMFLSYLTYADPTQNSKGTVSDLANGLYWGVVSMTTIGYGDVAPVTGLSKIILCIFALMGAGFIAMPAGIIGSGFALQVIEQRKLKEKTRRRRPAAELIQIAWKVYASNPALDLQQTWMPHMKLRVSMVHSNRSNRNSLDFSTLNGSFDSFENINFRNLTIGEKHAVGFIRRLQFNVAVRNFKQSTRPYDVKDILDRFAATHVEIFERIKEVRKRVDCSSKVQDEIKESKHQTEMKLENIEKKVNELTNQMADVTDLLRELVAEKYIQSAREGSNV